MPSALKKTFAAAVITAAASTALAADNDALSTTLNDLNLQESNVFYHAGTGVRIEESCEVDGNETLCQMELIYGADNRVQTLNAAYLADDEGNLVDISVFDYEVEDSERVPVDGAEFYSASSSNYAQKMRSTSLPDGNVKFDEASDNGFDAPHQYIMDRISNYRVEDGVQTTVGQALTQSDEFAYGGTYQTLDRFIRLEDTGLNSISESSCMLIPVAGAEATAYDIDIGESFRAICITQQYNQASNVQTTVTIHGLTDGGELQQASFEDVRPMGSAPNGEITQADDNRYDFLQEQLAGRVTGNIVNHVP